MEGATAEEKAKKLKAKKEKDEAKVSSLTINLCIKKLCTLTCTLLQKIERKARIKRGHLAQKGLDKLRKEERKAEKKVAAEERAERKRQIAIDHKPYDPLELGSELLPFDFQSMKSSK